jgi:hypothetical protein
MGFTRVSTEAEGVELESTTLGQQLLGIRVSGRALAEGETIRIVYGAGPQGARADRYAESASPFWIAVDGDGDGVRGTLPDSPTVAVRAGPPARLVVTVPTTARPEQPVRLRVAILDRAGNSGVDFEGRVRLRETPGLRSPGAVQLRSEDRGVGSVEVVPLEPGVYRIRAEALGGPRGVSNPLVVSEDGSRVLWGDLHGHSGLSDGTGTPRDYFGYARDVAGLDIVALTDHDHWGMLPLSRHPELWEQIREQVASFHDPGRFVALLGFEWTSWIHGHRHVLYFQDDGEVLSSVDPAYETPDQLWEALRGHEALTLAHHSAGGPVATNWAYPPDPELEPLTEVVSVHGSSEALDSAGLIYSPVRGNFVRDVLDQGHRLGFVGSGDGHDGHPGLAHLASPSGGLAAVMTEEATREAVLAALRARRTYATNGPRILLRARLGGRPMGSAVPAVPSELVVRVVAASSLERVDLIRSGQVAERVLCEGEEEVRFARRVESPKPGEYLYVRAVQMDGGAAWSSPFFFE